MASGLQVKGFAWLNVLDFVRERHGAATFDELVRAFPDSAHLFSAGGVLPIGWVPGELHIGALEWLATHRYDDTPDGARLMGFEIASRNVSTTFRSFARLEDLQVALTSTERAFGQFYSRGAMKLTLEGNELSAVLTDFPLPSEVLGNVLGAGLVAFLRGGHVEATLTTVALADGVLRWKARVELPASSRMTPLPR